MTTTYFRLLRENDQNYQAALQHAARTIDYLAGQVSCGMMRAAPVVPPRPLKPPPVALDIPPAAES